MRLLTISALVLTVAGGAVLARENFGKQEFMRRHMEKRIDAAFDAAKPSKEQRATLDATKQRVFTAIEASHQNHQANLQKVMQLFEADQLDAAQVKALRDAHETAARSDGDAIVAAITEAHDTLSAAQRRQVAEQLRSAKHDGPPKAVGEWFKKRALEHVNEALESVKASPQQRTAIETALEQVWNTVREEHAAGAGHLETAIQLFEADKIDAAQVAKLRADNTARRQKMGDVVVQAFHDVHDALTAAQRKQLVSWVRANHPHFGG
jgi:uncharacterized membrane protein